MSVKHFFSALLLFCICIGASAATATVIKYSYDANGRLTESAYNSTRITYRYDSNGNLIEYSGGSVFFWGMFLPAIGKEKKQVNFTPVINTNNTVPPVFYSNSGK